MKIFNFDVHGATCARCAAAAQRTLDGFGGDHQVDSDFAAVTATVPAGARL